MYHVGTMTSSADSWTISSRANVTVLSPDRETVLSFDLEGRPISWFLRGTMYKRSLGGQVHVRVREDGVRVRSVLSRSETAEMFERLLATAGSAPQQLGHQDQLDKIRSWTIPALLAEKERFESVYRPVSILPPDQYLAVVLQATWGCSWNRCTFCSFYQDRPFASRAVDEFRHHAEEVKEFLGAGLALRRSIFLADGNALVLGRDRLFPMMEIASSLFPGYPVHGFVDLLGGEKRSVAEWAELKRLGLIRVHIGLETGSDDLLGWLNKPGSAVESLGFVATLKKAGLQVALIFMVGAGGDLYRDRHREETVGLVAGLPLSEGDIIYLSPFLPEAGSTYLHEANTAGVQALQPGELDNEYKTLRDRIRADCPRVKVARYDIREFIY